MGYRLLMLCVVSLALATIACDRSQTTSASSATPAAPQAAETLPANLILASAPANPLDAAKARSSAKEGEQVAVRGTIAGRKEPMARNRAVFALLDPSIKTCDQIKGDACKTPWDVCCEPADSVAANIVTIQVVGKDGAPLKTGLEGVGGLAPLSHIIVVGTWRPSADGQAATVDASGIYVEPK